MADRSITVALEAKVQGFVTGFRTAETAVKDFTTRTGSYVEKNSAELEKVGLASMVMGGAILAGVGVAIKAYADFSGRLAQVKSLSKASATEMDQLANAALTMGQNIGLSANDVADAEIELTKAGVGVKDMMGGALIGALNLAAAGQIDVGAATEIATIALTQFKLEGKDVPHVADLLAAGADRALGSVDDLGMGLKQSGLVASQFGLSIDDTVGTLAAFANAGLMGSDAGTSFKTMLLALANPSEQAAGKMSELGIAAYDTEGNFVGVTNLAGQLQDKMGRLSAAERDAAMSIIFGSDAIRAANVLYKEGDAGIQGWIDNVNESGFAAAQAAGKLDSLQGDFKKLQAAVQNGMIQMGATADGFLRPVVQGVTKAVQTFNQLPEPVKGGALAFAALSGAGLLAGGALISIVPKAFETVNALKTLRSESVLFTKATNLMGKATLAAGVALGVLAAAAAVSKSMEPATASIEHTSQALIGLKRDGASVDQLFQSFKGSGIAAKDINGVGDALYRINNMDLNESVNKWFNDVANIGDKLKPAREQIAQIDSALANFVNSGSMDVAAQGFQKMAAEGEKHGVTLETTARSFPAYIAALEAQANALQVDLTQQELYNWALGQVPDKIAAAQSTTEGMATTQEIAAKATKEQADALAEVGISADGAIVSVDKFTQSLVNTGLVTLSARDAEAQFQEALDGVKAKIDGVNASASALNPVLNSTKTDFDLTSEAGRAANAVFADLETKGLNSAKAMATAGASQDQVQTKLEETYDSLVLAGKGFNMTDEDARALARSVLGVPDNVDIKSWMDSAAKSMAEATEQVMNRLNGKTINTYTFHHETRILTTDDRGNIRDPGSGVDRRAAAHAKGGIVRAYSGGGSVQHFPGGGAVSGPGTGTSDDVPAWLSDGEYVIKAQRVKALGERFFDSVNNGTFQTAPAHVSVAPAPQGRPPVTQNFTITPPPGLDTLQLGDAMAGQILWRMG